MVVVLCIGVVLGILVPGIHSAREHARRMQCGNYLKQLTLALQNYHDTFLALPRAEQRYAGTSHSWRMAVLPFAQSTDIYGTYDFTLPWNSTFNRGLTNGRLRDLHRCPSDLSSHIDDTSYLVITDPSTAFPTGRTISFDDFIDGTANTAILTEVRNSNISWTEPRDLPLVELGLWRETSHRPSLLGNHGAGTMVAFADGHVQYLPQQFRTPQWRALFTIAGGEKVEFPGDPTVSTSGAVSE